MVFFYGNKRTHRWDGRTHPLKEMRGRIKKLSPNSCFVPDTLLFLRNNSFVMDGRTEGRMHLYVNGTSMMMDAKEVSRSLAEDEDE